MISSAEIIAHQIAETRTAGRIRLWLIISQIGLTVPVAVSVFISSGTILFYLAAINLAAVLLWWWLSLSYSKHRHAAQSARRFSLLTNGLGLQISRFEAEQLKRSLKPYTEKDLNRSGHYYSSSRSPSPARLGDLVRESAFYSHHIQEISSRIIAAIIVAFLVLGAAILFTSLPSAKTDVLLSGVRLYFALSVFILSSEIFGAMNSHREAARMAERIYTSLTRVMDGAIPDGDILLIATEYIVGMAKVPEPLPLIFYFTRKRLDQEWRNHAPVGHAKHDRE